MGLKLGAKTDVKRLFISFRQSDIENSAGNGSGKSISIEYDALAGSDAFAIFAGLIAGYENNIYNAVDSTQIDHNSVFAGVNIGLTASFGPLGIDVGVRYTLPISPDVGTYTMGSTTTSYVGLHYQY